MESPGRIGRAHGAGLASAVLARIRSLLPHHRLYPLEALPRRRIVDHEAEIRPAIHRECRIFERQRAENRVSYVLDGIAVGFSNVVGPPHRPEFRAPPAELIDERLHFRRGACAGRVQSEGAQHEPRDAFSQSSCTAHARGSRKSKRRILRCFGARDP